MFRMKYRLLRETARSMVCVSAVGVTGWVCGGGEIVRGEGEWVGR